MKIPRLLGSLRILFAALVFPVTTLATCFAGALVLDFWHDNPWRWEYAWAVALGLTACAFFTAIGAFRDFGASGAFGNDPVKDFRDAFRRILFKHVLGCLGFLAPQVALGFDHSMSHYVVLASLLFVFKMVFIGDHVDDAIVDRTRYENRNRFMEGIGSSRRRKPTKGIRRR